MKKQNHEATRQKVVLELPSTPFPSANTVLLPTCNFQVLHLLSDAFVLKKNGLALSKADMRANYSCYCTAILKSCRCMDGGVNNGLTGICQEHPYRLDVSNTHHSSVFWRTHWIQWWWTRPEAGDLLGVRAGQFGAWDWRGIEEIEQLWWVFSFWYVCIWGSKLLDINIVLLAIGGSITSVSGDWKWLLWPVHHFLQIFLFYFFFWPFFGRPWTTRTSFDVLCDQQDHNAQVNV